MMLFRRFSTIAPPVGFSCFYFCGMPDRYHPESEFHVFDVDLRPERLNALSTEMYQLLINQIKQWSDKESAISAILVKGSGRAFSCGGDLRDVVESSQRGECTTGPTLLRLNFQLDYMIAQSKKPVITYIDGITFGGGSGLSMFSQYPICSERTLWGMPEVQIGYFPDCGSSYLFANKITGGKSWGTMLALRGQLLQSQHLLFAKIAPHFIQSKDWLAMEYVLKRWGHRLRNPARLESILDTDSATLSEMVRPLFEAFPVLDGEMQDCFDGVNEVEHLLENFERAAHKGIVQMSGQFQTKLNQIWKEYAKQTVQELQQASPLSLKLTYGLLNRVQEKDELNDCMNREWTVARNFVRMPNDLAEGVRAKLIDKDNNPKWKFPTLKSVDMELVKDYFKGWNDADDVIIH